MVLVDDFEDGDVSGWTGDTSLFSSTSNALVGSFSGLFVRGPDGPFAEVQSPSVAASDYTTLEFVCSPDQGDSVSDIRLVPLADGTELGQLIHNPGGSVTWQGPSGASAVTLGSFSYGTTYNYEISIDPQAETATVIRDGETLATGLDLRNSFGEGVTGIALAIDGSSPADSDNELRVDDIEARDVASLTAPDSASVSVQESGDLLVEWSETALADNYEVEVSEAGGNYQSVTTVSAGTTSTTYSQTDGVFEYRFRVRATAGSRTSAYTYTETLDIVVAPATDLVATATGTETVELTWTASQSDVDAHQVIRERQQAGAYQEPELIAELGSTAESYTDTGLYPGRTYRYRIVVTAADKTSESDTDTATTDDLGYPRERIPSDRWYVEIDDPETGQPLVPTVLEGTQPEQDLNDVPRIEVHVPPSDRWQRIAEDRPPMRVWRDGERQPIERFEGPQTKPDRTILYGRGGIGLDKDIETDVGATTDVDQLVRDLVDAETPYSKTVDDPANNVRDDVRVLRADSVASFQDAFVEVNDVAGNDIPVGIRVQPTRLVTEQVVWLQSSDEAETQSQLVRIDEFDNYWRGRAHELKAVGDTLSWEIQTQHNFDASELELQLRKEQPIADRNPEIEIRFDGTVVDTLPADLDGGGPDSAPGWYSVFISDVSGPIEAGSHTIEAEVTGTSANSDARWIVDGVGMRDTRYPADWSLGDGASGIVDGVLQGPGLYPDAVEITTEPRTTIEQVVGGRATADLNNTSGQQALAISNDGGDTYIETANTEEVVGSFASGTTEIQAKLTLSRYTADTTTSPAVGDGQQVLSSIELFANLDDTPFVAGTAYDGSVAEILSELAETYGFVWALEWDDAADTLSVEFTQPGQRDTATSAPVLDYQTETDTETLAERAVVYGRSRRVDEETITIQTTGYENIGDGYIKPGSEKVVDPNTDIVYRISDDYEVLFNQGLIRATEDGNIDNGQDVIVSYETRLRAEYELPDADGTGDTVRATFEGASTQQLTEQAAKALTKRLADPRQSAEVTLDRTAQFELVGALSVDAPIEPSVVSKLSRGDDTTTVLLGTRETERDVVEDVRGRLESIASAL